MAKYNINYYSTCNSTKANIADRCIRTLKNQIFRYLTENKIDILINKLQDFASSYNETPHSSIGLAPIEVNAATRTLFWGSYSGQKQKARDYSKDWKT